MSKKRINTTINENLYKKLKLLAIKLDKNANELIEEGMRYVLDKYETTKKDASPKE